MQNINPFDSIIPAVESFLKQLQHIDVIKEYNFQTLEPNADKLEEFQSAFLKFTQKVNDALALLEKTTENPCVEISIVSEINSAQDQPVQIEDNKNNSNSENLPQLQVDETEALHKKTTENPCIEVPNVSQINSGQDQPAQIDHNKNNSDSKNVQQLQVDETEIKRRINAFLSRKRKEVDEWNVQEFCSRPYVEEQNPAWEQVDSCARVDAVFIPRFGSKSHVKVSKVENRWGPQTLKHEPAKRIKTEPGLEAETETNDATFETIQERLRIIEAHLKLKSDSSVRNSIFQRIKQLEDRILFLEGISPDYFHLSGPSYSSTNKKSLTEKEKVYSNWNVDDIQKRIQALKESLKLKSVVKKEPTIS